MSEIFTIQGRNFTLTLTSGSADGAVHWILADPGKRLLSGEAPDAEAARACAKEAGQALLELEIA
jgi:hypothetical protein